MFYHIQGRRSYVGYQRLGRRLYEIVVDGGTPVFARNARALTDDAARIACSLEDADRLPYLLPNPIRASNVNEQIRIALRQRDLTLYPLPSIDAAQPFADQSGWGLGFAQGKPLPAACLHQYLNATVVPIDTIEQANVWLGKLAKPVPWTLILQHTGHLDQMTLNASGEKCRKRLAKLLAEGVVHAYQMPCRSGNRGALAEAKTPEEYLPVEGPGNRKATLGPHDQPGYVQKPREPKPQTTAAPPVQPGLPQSIEECEQRLAVARERLQVEGYQPKYSDEELLAAAQKGELDDRFVVRLMETSYASDDGYLGRPDAEGKVKFWSTTFNQAENGDTDPETLARLFGFQPKPHPAEYTLVVVDTLAPGAGQSVVMVPTHANLAELSKQEIKGIPGEHVDAVMTPEYNDVYEEHIAKFHNDGREVANEKDVSRYADTHFTAPEDKARFKTRAAIHKELGANEEFTGDGTTKNLLAAGGQRGVMETLTVDKNPQTLGNLESSGSAKRLSAKRL